MTTKHQRRFTMGWFAGLAAAGLMLQPLAKAEPGHDFSRDTARSSPTWLRDGVIYEIFPRNFSQAGDFKGITARLDELHDLGVTILWLMPIHPSGKEKSKGTLPEVPTRCGIITRSIRITGQRRT